MAAIPALLMLAAIGLERIETGLNRGGAATAEATALLQRADVGAEYVTSRCESAVSHDPAG